MVHGQMATGKKKMVLAAVTHAYKKILAFGTKKGKMLLKKIRGILPSIFKWYFVKLLLELMCPPPPSPIPV